MNIKNLKNKKKYILLISFLSLYLAHQIYFIFVGGTTWDEPASILSASKQFFKAYFFFFDYNNPIFEKSVPPPEKLTLAGILALIIFLFLKKEEI